MEGGAPGLYLNLTEFAKASMRRIRGIAIIDGSHLKSVLSASLHDLIVRTYVIRSEVILQNNWVVGSIVDRDRLATPVGRVEREILEHPLQHGVQPVLRYRAGMERRPTALLAPVRISTLVDGVMVIDAAGLARLLAVTGPIEVEEVDVDAATVAQREVAGAKVEAVEESN